MFVKKPIALVLAFFVSLALFGTAPVQKASAAPWVPSTNLVFNNLLGGTKGKYKIITQLDHAINAAPRGSRITMAQYLFNIDSTAKALVRAHKRGVQVQVLIDDGENTKQVRLLKRELGKFRPGRSSFYATCSHSCMSNTGSTMHAKFYLFSTTGGRDWVSMIASGNPHRVNTIASWNNMHTIVGRELIYDQLRGYFVDMLKDKNNLNYYATRPPVTSGKYTLYFYPRAARRASQVVVLDALNHTACTGVRSPYGYRGRTYVRIEMWGWTSTRIDIARRVKYLWDRGCNVSVIINRARISRSVLKTLLGKSNRGVMPVYDAWVDKNKNDFGEKYMHHKTTMINGKVYGKDQKVVYTGSQNFTAAGTLYNNDLILRVVDGRTYDAYANNMIYIRQHATKRLKKVPKVLRDTHHTGGEQRVQGYEDPGLTDADLETIGDE